MKRVLIVAYHYPPVGEVGAVRTLKFTKFLPEFGFAPYVLTVRNRSVARAVDPTLEGEIPAEAQVIETFSAEHRILRAPRLLGLDPKWFLLPDVHIGWLPFAVRRGEAIIHEEDVSVILATTPIVTSLLVGHLLKVRTGRPLVVDFRDPWTQNVFTTYPTRLHRRIEERLEAMVLKSADYVTTTTDEIREALVEKYPFIHGRSDTIPNGFDASDFRGLKRTVSKDRFTITYAGSLYGLRTSEHFLTAIRSLVERERHLRKQLRVLFAGPKDGRTLNLVRELHLGDIVDITGFVAHRESLQLMVNADVLLLLLGRGELGGDGLRAMMIPSKTFEYLAARRPILALAPEGAASDLVRRTESGIVVPPDEPDAIEGAVLRLFNEWQAGTLHVAPYDISVFDRRAQTARLAGVLRLLCSQ